MNVLAIPVQTEGHVLIRLMDIFVIVSLDMEELIAKLVRCKRRIVAHYDCNPLSQLQLFYEVIGISSLRDLRPMRIGAR